MIVDGTKLNRWIYVSIVFSVGLIILTLYTIWIGGTVPQEYITKLICTGLVMFIVVFISMLLSLVEVNKI
jgi:hypothetical protein